MKKSELKQLIRECINESFINENLPAGKSELARKCALTLNSIISQIRRPDLQDEAGRHAAGIIELIDKDNDS